MSDNQMVPKKYIKYYYRDFGVRFDIPYLAKNIRIQAKIPLPPITAFPDIENKFRTVIDYKFIDIRKNQKDLRPEIYLTIYLTQADLAFASNDIDSIVIYDWKPSEDDGEWQIKGSIIERGSISPPLWSKYVGYIKLEITSWDDPPIAVGK